MKILLHGHWMTVESSRMYHSKAVLRQRLLQRKIDSLLGEKGIWIFGNWVELGVASLVDSIFKKNDKHFAEQAICELNELDKQMQEKSRHFSASNIKVGCPSLLDSWHAEGPVDKFGAAVVQFRPRSDLFLECQTTEAGLVHINWAQVSAVALAG